MISQSPELIEINDENVEIASKIFTHAFSKSLSGLFYICTVERDGFEDRLRKFFHVSNKFHLSEHQLMLGLIVQDQLVGVAAITNPLYCKSLLKKIVFLIQLLWVIDFSTAYRYLRYSNLVNKFLPKGDFLYINRIAVEPDFQRLGYGKILLQEIHQRSDKDQKSMGVALETANPDNVKYYGQLGYQAVYQIDTPIVQETVMVRWKNQNKSKFKHCDFQKT